MIDDVQLDACNFYKYSEKILIIIYFNAVDRYFLGLTFRLSTDHGRTNGHWTEQTSTSAATTQTGRLMTETWRQQTLLTDSQIKTQTHIAGFLDTCNITSPVFGPDPPTSLTVSPVPTSNHSPANSAVSL